MLHKEQIALLSEQIQNLIATHHQQDEDGKICNHDQDGR
jgi:hypothetical protein